MAAVFGSVIWHAEEILPERLAILAGQNHHPTPSISDDAGLKNRVRSSYPNHRERSLSIQRCHPNCHLDCSHFRTAVRESYRSRRMTIDVDRPRRI